MKLKTHKTLSKRLKLTKRGKMIKRKGGQDHFNTRESGKVTRNKRRDLAVSKRYVRRMKALMPNA